jgi:hypothetical protein
LNNAQKQQQGLLASPTSTRTLTGKRDAQHVKAVLMFRMELCNGTLSLPHALAGQPYPQICVSQSKKVNMPKRSKK